MSTVQSLLANVEPIENPYAAPESDTAPKIVSRPSGTLDYAGFWKRLGASVVDSLVLLIPLIAIIFVASALDNSPLSPILFGSGILGALLYYPLMESSSSQATVGKIAAGIIVTNLRGDRISFARALMRMVLKTVVNAINVVALINAIVIGTSARKQGLHDMMAGTLVLNRTSFLPGTEEARNPFEGDSQRDFSGLPEANSSPEFVS